MKAMILAAGRGERLRPLTDKLPKPLLPVAGKPLIEYTIESLVAAGFPEIVINLAYLGDAIECALGDGARFGARLHYSYEGETGLETAGGIVHALPLLGPDSFLVVNGDILTNFPFRRLKAPISDPVYLVLVENPRHHPTGDFALERNRIRGHGNPMHTFSGIGVYSPDFFKDCKPGKFPLLPLFRTAIERAEVGGELYSGLWMDLGTVERYREAEEYVRQGRLKRY